MVTGPRLHGKLDDLLVCCEGSRAGHKQPRRFLQGVEDSILRRTLDELTRAGLSLTDKVDQAEDLKDDSSHGCSGQAMVEKQDQLRKLQEQLYHLRWSTKDVAEWALQEGVKQAKLPGFTGQAVQDIISQALEMLEEIQVPMPDYALKSAGAAVIHSRTSPSLRNAKTKVFLYSLPVADYMRSPELILEPQNQPGNCRPFPGSQGHVFIKLSVPVIPRAVTMDHVSGTAFHGESSSGAPKDFAVYGFKEEHEEQGTFLGQFTFLAALNPSQTFQLKNELPGVVNYVRLQVLSNWGHPDYTCLYRFRVHGDPPKDKGEGPVSSVNKFH
ncbi:SUN domain-containing protein 3-like [Caloenas nicobarica]|uniref:SUN domain-containing protein 3-like n=1 Tax=Caloenas nicobarica TaxID=187106 RepID=UPI0032B759BE